MTTTTELAPLKKEEQKKESTPSERFMLAIEREFASNPGEVSLTSYQRKLCQNYFIKIDLILKKCEVNRMAKKENYRDPLEFTWHNINLPQLAIDVITFSSVGLDPLQANHINPIPYKNNKTQKFDVTFIPGYKGIELKAKKYGYDIPDDIVVELVFSNDKFIQFKKDINNKIENYTFEVTDNFNRGEIIGGFYYHKYFETPEKNKLRVFSKKDIDKRKPEYASAEFWGGEKDKWEYDETTGRNKKVGKEEVEGWYDEMAYKTVYRAAFNAITIDSEKIDKNYLAVIEKEREARDLKVTAEIQNNSNGATGNSAIGFPEENEDFNNAEVVTTDENATSGPAPVIMQTSIGNIVVKEPEKISVAEQATSTSSQNGKSIQKGIPF